MKVTEIVNASASLTAAAASTANYSVPLLLVDTVDVPYDTRYLEVTKSDYATNLTAASAHLLWCTDFWSQTANPAPGP